MHTSCIHTFLASKLEILFLHGASRYYLALALTNQMYLSEIYKAEVSAVPSGKHDHGAFCCICSSIPVTSFVEIKK